MAIALLKDGDGGEEECIAAVADDNGAPNLEARELLLRSGC